MTLRWYLIFGSRLLIFIIALLWVVKYKQMNLLTSNQLSQIVLGQALKPLEATDLNPTDTVARHVKQAADMRLLVKSEYGFDNNDYTSYVAVDNYPFTYKVYNCKAFKIADPGYSIFSDLVDFRSISFLEYLDADKVARYKRMGGQDATVINDEVGIPTFWRNAVFFRKHLLMPEPRKYEYLVKGLLINELEREGRYDSTTIAYAGVAAEEAAKAYMRKKYGESDTLTKAYVAEVEANRKLYSMFLTVRQNVRFELMKKQRYGRGTPFLERERRKKEYLSGQIAPIIAAYPSSSVYHMNEVIQGRIAIENSFLQFVYITRGKQAEAINAFNTAHKGDAKAMIQAIRG